MKLTKERRKKIAKAAREIAYQTAEGRGPRLDGLNWCGCAIGRSIRRARVGPRNVINFSDLAREIDNLLPLPPPHEIDPVWWNDMGLVSRATSAQCNGLPGAVVFPLLALADALEGK